MFAVIENGNRQYCVREGDTFNVDLCADVAKGDTVAFDRVLLANAGGASTVGKPVIKGALVEAQVINPVHKGEKIEVQKMRRRKNYRRHTGHRQKYTTVRITSIKVPGLETRKGSDE